MNFGSSGGEGNHKHSFIAAFLKKGILLRMTTQIGFGQGETEEQEKNVKTLSHREFGHCWDPRKYKHEPLCAESSVLSPSQSY